MRISDTEKGSDLLQSKPHLPLQYLSFIKFYHTALSNLSISRGLFYICHKKTVAIVIYYRKHKSYESFHKKLEVKNLSQKANIRFIEKCYQLYEQKMYQVAYSILRDERMAEDAVQEAFLKLMKSKILLKDANSDDCKRYMITVIKNASITIYNKQKMEQEVVYISERHKDFSSTINKEDEDKEELREYITQLPEKYYEVVNCLVVKELSTKETAEELTISEANVRKRFERAKWLLKNMMKGCDEYEGTKIV